MGERPTARELLMNRCIHRRGPRVFRGTRATPIFLVMLTMIAVGMSQTVKMTSAVASPVVYENPDLAPGVTSVSTTVWKDTKVDCRQITETADLYLTMTQGGSWLDITVVAGECTVTDTNAPMRSGDPTRHSMSSGSMGGTSLCWAPSGPPAAPAPSEGPATVAIAPTTVSTASGATTLERHHGRGAVVTDEPAETGWLDRSDGLDM